LSFFEKAISKYHVIVIQAYEKNVICHISWAHEHNLRIGTKSLDSVAKLRCLWTTLANKNCICEETESRWTQEMPATIHSRSFCLPVCCPKNIAIIWYRIMILPVVNVGVELGLSHWGRNIGWGCSRIGCWGGYWA
jgi:hypothetical protein